MLSTMELINRQVLVQWLGVQYANSKNEQNEDKAQAYRSVITMVKSMKTKQHKPDDAPRVVPYCKNCAFYRQMRFRGAERNEVAQYGMCLQQKDIITPCNGYCDDFSEVNR